MANLISGTGGNSLVPLNNNLPANFEQPVPNTAEPRIVSPGKEVEQIDPWTHHNTFSGIRSALYPLDTLKKFIDWQRDKLDKPQILKFRKAVIPDPLVEETIKDIFPQFDKSGMDLIDVIKNRFIQSCDFEEKIIYLKVFYSTSNEDILINDVLVPALEKRQGFKNLEANNEFCKYFLSSLGKEPVSSIFKKIDYKRITDSNTFATSLMTLTSPELPLQNLFDLNEELLFNNDDSNEHKANIGALQETLISYMNQLSQYNLSTVSVDKLTSLYRKAVSIEIMDRAGDFLSAEYPKDAQKIFKDTFCDRSDESQPGRLRRFNAVGDYAVAAKEYGAKTLGEFIQDEKDSFLASIATYCLVSFCETDGNRAVIDTIVKQIRRQEPSLPLACTIQLIPYSDKYKKIITNILSRPYKTEEGLKNMFFNLENAEICEVGKDNSNKMRFNPSRNIENDLVIKLIKGIGLDHLIQMASNNRTDMSNEEQWQRHNSLEILEYAWEKNRSQMMSLFLETVPFSNYDDLDITIRKMAGMGSVNPANGTDSKGDKAA